MNINNSSTKAYKILLIDDDVGITRLIAILLERGGYETVSAHSGAEGIALAKKEQPDLILCDVMMPDADGFDVLQALQNQSDTATIPFIFLTARTKQEDMRFGMNLGADDYLTKPVRAESLLNAVATRLNRHQTLHAERLATFSQRLVLAQEYSRQQMATMLENDIGQSLRSLQFVFNMLDMPTDVDLFSETKKQLAQIIQRVEGLAQELHPTILGRLGLLPAIRWLAEQYEIGIELDAENFAYKFEPQIEVGVFRLVQEALNNAALHAQANNVVVTLAYVEPYINISIADDGVGFDLEQVLQSDKGMGLQYMYGLTASLKGELHITSAPNEGTSIYVVLPQATAGPAVRQSISKRFLRMAGRPAQSGRATATTGPIKILLAMEQPLQLQGLKRLLDDNSRFHIVGEVQQLANVSQAIKRESPQLLMIDPVMKDVTQTDILQTIMTDYPETAVLVISASAHEEYIRSAFESGVLGYMPNTATMTDLHTAIMRVAQKQYYVSPILQFDLAGWLETQA